MRKIIQIASSAVPSTMGEQAGWDNLWALCDDGSLWVKDSPFQTDGEAPKWKRIENVPQAEDPVDF